jgi:hypothetical protein
VSEDEIGKRCEVSPLSVIAAKTGIRLYREVRKLGDTVLRPLPFKGRAGVGMGLTASGTPIPLPTSPLNGEEFVPQVIDC